MVETQNQAASKLADMDPEEKEIEQKMVKIIQAMSDKVQPRFKILKALAD